eukprot:356956_1
MSTFTFSVSIILSLYFVTGTYIEKSHNPTKAFTSLPLIKSRKLLNNFNQTNISKPVQIAFDTYTQVCEFQLDTNGCEFSISDAQVCCHYIAAKNNYVANISKSSSLQRKDINNKIKSLKDITLSSFVIM